MTDVEQMQQSLDRTLIQITELEEQIQEIKSNPAAAVELKDARKKLAVQQRVKITLIQSIEELTPTSTALIIPSKLPTTFLSKVSGFFKSIFN